MSLIFNIDQKEYVGHLAEAAGVRIVVHPQATMPFPEDEGLSIGPGQLSYVGIKFVSRSRYLGNINYLKIYKKSLFVELFVFVPLSAYFHDME